MRAIFRIFNQCFDGGEWFVMTTVPDDFAHNLQLNDIISTQVLMSFKEFNCADFILTLKDDELKNFSAVVKQYQLRYNQTEERAKTNVFQDWFYDWNLTVTARKWCKNPRQSDFMLEFWVEDKS